MIVREDTGFYTWKQVRYRLGTSVPYRFVGYAASLPPALRNNQIGTCQIVVLNLC